MKPFSILATLGRWHRRYRTRRQLPDLPPDLLRDVGLDDAARAGECAQWLWQGIPDDDDGAASNKNAHGITARVHRLEIESDQTLRRSLTTTSTRAIS